VTTFSDYDPLTFRLRRIASRRDSEKYPSDCHRSPRKGWPGSRLQSLKYTYDPVGNVVSIRDNAQQTIFFDNQRVDPITSYTYDAIYRLIAATGREHLGQNERSRNQDFSSAGRSQLSHPGDGQAMGRYRQSFIYDAVGNILRMKHRSASPANGGWSLDYKYDEPSLTEPSKTNNRLSLTCSGGADGLYEHDAHGNMTRMPHLPELHWDSRDRLAMTRREAGKAKVMEKTYYGYDSEGQRVRKVTERSGGSKRNERVYLGVFEVYREYDTVGTAVTLERETLHIMDDQQRVAMFERRTKGDNGEARLIRYQLANHLGSSCVELDHEANVISYEEYFPYGSTAYQAGTPSLDSSPKRYRYTAKERDEENGLYYHGARYYCSWLSRWTSFDPDESLLPTTPYVYCSGNPTNLTDVTGKYPISWLGKTHETITDEAVSQIPPQLSPRASSDFRQGLIEGVRYPDLPDGLTEMARVKLAIEAGRGATVESSLTFRSHFGDLQHWHSMSSRGIGSATELKKEILDRASELYDQAITEPDQRRSANYIGRILHTVQDSWSPAHVERAAAGEISGFQAYELQDPSKHSEVEGPKNVKEESWQSVRGKVPGAIAAREVSTTLIATFLQKDKKAFMHAIDRNYVLAPDAYVGRSAQAFSSKPSSLERALQKLERTLGSLEWEIRRLYGVPY
jgi:RHS repeat-associated protein